MKALFVCGFTNGIPSVPPMKAIESDGLQLHYVEGGILKGGYSMVGAVPQGPTAIVQIDASPATIAAMDALPDYFFLEEVEDGPII